MSLATVGWGSLVLCAGLSARLLAAFTAVSGGSNNIKEKIFISLAWLPKATVQAALGPVALGKARDMLDQYIADQDGLVSCDDISKTDGNNNYLSI